MDVGGRADVRSADGSSGAGEAGEEDAGWRTESRCEGSQSYPEPDEEFEKPDRSRDIDPPSDKVLEERYGGEYPKAALSLYPDSHLEPGPGRPFDLYAEPGEDVTFEVGVVVNPYTDRFEPSFENRYLMFSLLVDYEPVEFSYRILGGEGEVRAEGEATGRKIPLEDHVTVLEVTIPGEEFADRERRWFELGMMSVFQTKELGNDFASFSRFALYYGGKKRPTHECFEPSLEEEMNEVEKFFGSEEFDSIFLGISEYLLFPEAWMDDARKGDTESIPVYPDGYEVRPGEEVTFHFSAISWLQDGPRKTKRTIARPFIDGRPVGDGKWNFQAIQQGAEESTGTRVVNARKEFTIEAPDEPGTYDVMVAGWEDTYLKAFEGLPRTRNWEVDEVPRRPGSLSRPTTTTYSPTRATAAYGRVVTR